MPKKYGMFTEEARQTIVTMIGCGNFFSTACAAAGVYETTFKGYLDRGEAILRGMNNEETAGAMEYLPEEDLLCLQFYVDVKAAEARAEHVCVQVWFEESEDKRNWQAARGFLERRFGKDKWAPNAAPDDAPAGERPKIVEVVEPEDADNTSDSELGPSIVLGDKDDAEASPSWSVACVEV
jgi:hypothetical protein